jgi:hypothetical protein
MLSTDKGKLGASQGRKAIGPQQLRQPGYRKGRFF